MMKSWVDPQDFVFPHTGPDGSSGPSFCSRTRQATAGGHADEIETSMMMAHRPDLAHPEHPASLSSSLIFPYHFP
jgi:creatinine amidohydrolase/Fe(II)-dependent formamide hydrolase-like protein